MLKVLKESQKPTLTVTGGIPMPGITIATTDQIILIYDVNRSESTFFNYSKVTYVINELFGIQSASANPLVLAVPTGIELWLGSSIIVGGVLYKMDNEYQASTNYSRDYTPNAPKGSYLPALTSNPMLGGLNTGLFANTIDQMRFDGIIPEVDTSTARNNSVGNHGRTMPIAHTATSALLQEIRMDIDPNASKPTILSTPIAYQPKSILFTSDDRSTFVQWSQLPGFMPGYTHIGSILESNIIAKTQASSIAITEKASDDNSGICKQSHPYFPEDHKVKEDWMEPKFNLSGKQKTLLASIAIYGTNPHNVTEENGITIVNTELLGGEDGARECFKNLTGRYPVGIHDNSNKDGTIIGYRALGKSGHPKVDINGKNTTKVFEKITFK